MKNTKAVKVSPKVEISEDVFDYEIRYFGYPDPMKWKAHNVKIDDENFVVYVTKSGWLLSSETKGTFGKKRKGAGWIGFGSPKEAIDNYIAQEWTTKQTEITPEDVKKL